eukprot:CAMPEP_0182463598 /NCGR_PEP_ID=MMETSP1319-20130603/7745_1 /TAXON_ID=172717 /ORGANISM="Bolidomonas pacifica, Strain RCC208" /LENGTH=92 /DNA_ID=CAMNT_0024663163 /DNA_START=229 /DNA_END=503 /DNA_ORIENTATION=+
MAPALVYTVYSYRSGVGHDNTELEEKLRSQYRKQHADPRTLAARSATVDRLKQMHSSDPRAQDELRDALAGGKESRRHGRHNRIPLVALGGG